MSSNEMVIQRMVPFCPRTFDHHVTVQFQNVGERVLPLFFFFFFSFPSSPGKGPRTAAVVEGVDETFPRR